MENVSASDIQKCIALYDSHTRSSFPLRDYSLLLKNMIHGVTDVYVNDDILTSLFKRIFGKTKISEEPLSFQQCLQLVLAFRTMLRAIRQNEEKNPSPDDTLQAFVALGGNLDRSGTISLDFLHSICDTFSLDWQLLGSEFSQTEELLDFDKFAALLRSPEEGDGRDQQSEHWDKQVQAYRQKIQKLMSSGSSTQQPKDSTSVPLSSSVTSTSKNIFVKRPTSIMITPPDLAQAGHGLDISGLQPPNSTPTNGHGLASQTPSADDMVAAFTTKSLQVLARTGLAHKPSTPKKEKPKPLALQEALDRLAEPSARHVTDTEKKLETINNSTQLNSLKPAWRPTSRHISNSNNNSRVMDFSLPSKLPSRTSSRRSSVGKLSDDIPLSGWSDTTQPPTAFGTTQATQQGNHTNQIQPQPDITDTKPPKSNVNRATNGGTMYTSARFNHSLNNSLNSNHTGSSAIPLGSSMIGVHGVRSSSEFSQHWISRKSVNNIFVPPTFERSSKPKQRIALDLQRARSLFGPQHQQPSQQIASKAQSQSRPGISSTIVPPQPVAATTPFPPSTSRPISSRPTSAYIRQPSPSEGGAAAGHYNRPASGGAYGGYDRNTSPFYAPSSAAGSTSMGRDEDVSSLFSSITSEERHTWHDFMSDSDNDPDSHEGRDRSQSVDKTEIQKQKDELQRIKEKRLQQRRNARRRQSGLISGISSIDDVLDEEEEHNEPDSTFDERRGSASSTESLLIAIHERNEAAKAAERKAKGHTSQMTHLLHQMLLSVQSSTVADCYDQQERKGNFKLKLTPKHRYQVKYINSEARKYLPKFEVALDNYLRAHSTAKECYSTYLNCVSEELAATLFPAIVKIIPDLSLRARLATQHTAHTTVVNYNYESDMGSGQTIQRMRQTVAEKPTQPTVEAVSVKPRPYGAPHHQRMTKAHANRAKAAPIWVGGAPLSITAMKTKPAPMKPHFFVG